MRIKILILLSIISIRSSYASFPKSYILDTIQNQEIMEYKDSFEKIGEGSLHKKDISLSGNSFAVLSVLSAFSSFLFAFLTLVSGISRDTSSLQINIFLLLFIISFVGSFLLGNKARKKGVSIGKVVLGSIIAVLGIGLFYLLFLN